MMSTECEDWGDILAHHAHRANPKTRESASRPGTGITLMVVILDLNTLSGTKQC